MPVGSSMRVLLVLGCLQQLHQLLIQMSAGLLGLACTDGQGCCNHIELCMQTLIDRWTNYTNAASGESSLDRKMHVECWRL